MKAPIIVGVNASHNAAAALFADGHLVRAIQLERLTRVKRDGHGYLGPTAAINYVLASVGLDRSRVDMFAFNCQPLLPGYSGLSLPIAERSFDAFDPFGARALYVSHHLAHAFGAMYIAGGGTRTAMVIDGAGGFVVGADDLLIPGTEMARYLGTAYSTLPPLHVQSVYDFEPSGYELVERETAPTFNVLAGSASLGETYASVSKYVFGDWHEGGKLMGLAPYGDAEQFGPSLLRRDDHGRLVFRNDWKSSLTDPAAKPDPLALKDLAARVQADLSEALVDRARRAIERTGKPDLAYAGGVALNSVANEHVRRRSGCTSLSIMPAADDSGTSVGAAAACHFWLTGVVPGDCAYHDFLGHPYNDDECASALTDTTHVVASSTMAVIDVAARLEHGQVIAVFQSASEFGPRALGHRSILADPRSRSMWDYINKRVKRREEFRPFAPIVPIERAGEYFEIDGPSPFMQRVVPVRAAYRASLAAVTHVDGSARVQTVDRETLPFLHELLDAFGARTGFPVLLNTSLNLRGEPVVETPAEAIELLLASHIDALVLGQRLVVPHAATQPLCLDDCVKLAAGATVVTSCDDRTVRNTLHSTRSLNASVPIADDLTHVLRTVGGGQTIRAALDIAGVSEQAERERLLTQLNALRDLRLLHRLQPDKGDDATTIRSTELTPWWTSPFDGSQSDAEAVCRRVLQKARTLGVTRVADLDEYDIIGIPVCAAVRPDVLPGDVTSSTGKGLSSVEARAGALMEGAEWHAASSYRPTILASCADLGARRTAHLAITSDDGQPLEWVPSLEIPSRRRVLIPASAVLYPYTPPAGAGMWCTPSTTGLAARMTFAAAATHALCEVVEREAVARFTRARFGRRLDPRSLSGVNADIAARVIDQRVHLAVFDLSDGSSLPTFLAATWERDGLVPPIPLAGHCSALSPSAALRGALLEAIQARTAAIQGSREDLGRYRADWEADVETGREAWQRLCGDESMASWSHPEHSNRPADPTADLQQAIIRVGISDVNPMYVTDLTAADVGIPVVHVLVPALIQPDRLAAVAST